MCSSDLYARANPGKVDYATAGPASFGHLATELFAKRAGLQMNHIPYKGQAPTAQAVLTGEVKLLISTTSSQMNAFIKDGKMRLLGVASPQPSPLAPGATPISQSVPGFNAEVWFGLLAPAGTPKDVIAKLNDVVTKVLAMPEVQAKFEAAGAAFSVYVTDDAAPRLRQTQLLGKVKIAGWVVATYIGLLGSFLSSAILLNREVAAVNNIPEDRKSTRLNSSH